MNNPCKRRVLAQGHVGLVEECACGKIHVNVGPVTLHFDLEAMASFGATLQAAVAEAYGARERAANDLRLLFGESPERHGARRLD
jgi:hypothetical protein